MHKALTNIDELPPLDEYISSYVRPDKELFEESSDIIDAFNSAFDLIFKTDVDSLKKKKIYWRDLIKKEERRKNEDTISQLSENAHLKIVEKDDKLSFQETPVSEISSVNPTEDFNSMIKDRSADRVDAAVSQMQRIIEQLIMHSVEGDVYPKALDCLDTLRKGCVSEDEAEVFNKFLRTLKKELIYSKHRSFWQLVIDKGISLIDKSESRLSTVSVVERRKFLEPLPKEDRDRSKKDKQKYEDSLMADVE